jgi:hypothetical protein
MNKEIETKTIHDKETVNHQKEKEKVKENNSIECTIYIIYINF